MITLGIETSCDECAVALLRGNQVLGRVVASQIEQHRIYQGVAPEVASRLHAELIAPSVQETFRQASLIPAQIDLVAYTNRPGLVGSLLVGAGFAKNFAWALGKPSIAVNHVLAHLFVASMVHPELTYPFIGVVASGGHTIIVRAMALDQVEVLGSTLDDAIGECYDKVAKFYNMGYPGGPAVDALAQTGDPTAFRFPSANLSKRPNSHYDMSFSGIKTAVINQKEQFLQPGKTSTPANIAASFQNAAIGQLIKKVERALTDFSIKTLVIGGGVAANSHLRKSVQKLRGVTVCDLPLSLCGDNGEMIAFYGSQLYALQGASSLDTGVEARAPLFKRGLKSGS